MHEEIASDLEPLLTKWTMGGSALSHVPSAWKEVVEQRDEGQELRLLALAGLCAGTIMVPDHAGEITARLDLPALSFPALPPRLRPLALRAISDRNLIHYRRNVLEFLIGRGHTMHPADWMPGSSDDVPDVYAAWQDWTAKQSPTTGHGAWDEYGPAQRRRMLTELRRTDPASARNLIAENVSGEKPEVRLSLIGLLAQGLGPDDIPLLERMTSDRAPTVQTLARSLLARLGQGKAEDEQARELADYFETSMSGIIRKTRTVVARTLRTSAQHSARDDRMRNVDLQSFAQALGMEDGDLVRAWNWGKDHHADVLFATMIARSGSDECVALVSSEIASEKIHHPDVVTPLSPRLSSEVRDAAIRKLLAMGGDLQWIVEIAGGRHTVQDLRRTATWRALLKKLDNPQLRPTDHADSLLLLALIATPSEASAIISDLATIGIPNADPRLDMLRINAAL